MVMAGPYGGWYKNEGCGTRMRSFDTSASHRRGSRYGLQVLGHQARLPAAGPYVHNLEGFACQQREGQGTAQNLPPTLSRSTVDPDHDTAFRIAAVPLSILTYPQGSAIGRKA
jgi:hypothetical protein